MTHSYPASSGPVSFAYNRQGEQISMTDENGTLHEYAYDKLGRQTSDKATLAGGSSIDNAVLRIDRTFTLLGWPVLLTSYSDAAGTTVVNQVENEYDELGQLTAQWQEPAGAVSGSSLKTEYSYADGSANTVRRTSMTGRWLQRDPVGYEAGWNLYEYVSDAPSGFTDPFGAWRFVPGMGSLSGELRPGDASAYGAASSSFELQFDSDQAAFKANRNGTCCAQVRFVQIYYTTARSRSLQYKTWTIDSDTPPFYEVNGVGGSWRNPATGTSTMHDDPYFETSVRNRGSVALDLEVCAVCSKSKTNNKGVGDVFACLQWGHSFSLAGAIGFTRVTAWKRYVELDVRADSDRIVVGAKKSTTLNFKNIAKRPSATMQRFLTEYL